MKKNTIQVRRSSIDNIMDRIKTANNRSPILVIKVEGGIDAVFADTVVSQEIIESGIGVVGIYCGDMPPITVRRELEGA